MSARRYAGRALTVLALALLALVALCVARALLVKRRAVIVPPALEFELEPLALSRRLAGALRIRTVSSSDPDAFERGAFAEMRRYLSETFGRVRAELEVERPSDASLLYTWRGSDPSLAPIVLLAHLDVVPVEAGTEGDWTAPPFAGEIANGFVYGRGALDDKASAVAILEGIELLLRRGHVPRRTVLVAFGMDEELGGERGAAAVAALLEARGVAPAFVLDEGMFLVQGFLPGFDPPIAAIGVAEKGSAQLELRARSTGGHGSMPPEHTAVGLVARAVARIEAHPMPAQLDPPTSLFFERLLPDFPFARRIVLANAWLTEPLVVRTLARAPATNALLRSTLAPTFVEGGDASNALPLAARAVVNVRVHPHDTAEGVLEHARAVIDDPEVELEWLGSTAPSRISPASGEAFDWIERTALQVFPNARVAPALCVAATDARHYARLTPNVYRFLPARLTPAEASALHGTDERIALSSYLEMVRFYAQLVANGG